MTRDIRVPTFGRFVRAHPHPRAPRVTTRELTKALTRECTTDLHFVAYTIHESAPFRLSKRSKLRTAMQLAVLESDDPIAHKLNIPATPAWRKKEAPKIKALVRKHPDAFVYQTRGGYRIVARLAKPFVIATAQDDAAWNAQYKSWLRYLTRVFDIEADPACADWTRLYRLPHAKRDGVVQELATEGDPANIGEWAPALVPSDVVEPDEDVEGDDQEEQDVHATTLPLAERVLKATDIARAASPAISGENGHNTLLAVAADIYRGCALPRKAALHILRNIYNPRCEPPWSPRELAHKLDAVAARGEPWGHLLDKALEELVPEDEPEPPAIKPAGGNLAERLRKLRGRGERQKLGFESIDGDVTRGGIPLESVTFIGGAPGAGKTGFVVHQAMAFAQRGYPVSILACDERADGLAIRAGQILGVERDGLEAGITGPVAANRLGNAPISLYDAREGYTIESVAKALYDSHGSGLLVVDSLQTAAVDAAKKDRGKLEETDAMKRVCKVVMSICAKYKHAALITSELNREFYRNARSAEELNYLAAFKGSGAIEHAADLAIVLLTTRGGKQVRAIVAKNRLGYGMPEFFLEWDPDHATMTEVQEIKEDGYDLGDEDGPHEEINLERVAWQTVRDTPTISSRNMLVFAVLRNGTKAPKVRIREAVDALFLDARVVRGADGILMANPWGPEPGDVD